MAQGCFTYADQGGIWGRVDVMDTGETQGRDSETATKSYTKKSTGKQSIIHCQWIMELNYIIIYYDFYCFIKFLCQRTKAPCTLKNLSFPLQFIGFIFILGLEVLPFLENSVAPVQVPRKSWHTGRAEYTTGGVLP